MIPFGIRTAQTNADHVPSSKHAHPMYSAGSNSCAHACISNDSHANKFPVLPVMHADAWASVSVCIDGCVCARWLGLKDGVPAAMGGEGTRERAQQFHLPASESFGVGASARACGRQTIIALYGRRCDGAPVGNKTGTPPPRWNRATFNVSHARRPLPAGDVQCFRIWLGASFLAHTRQERTAHIRVRDYGCFESASWAVNHNGGGKFWRKLQSAVMLWW